MESDVKAPDPWNKESKDEGGVHHPQPFFSFNNKGFRSMSSSKKQVVPWRLGLCVHERGAREALGGRRRTLSI